MGVEKKKGKKKKEKKKNKKKKKKKKRKKKKEKKREKKKTKNNGKRGRPQLSRARAASFFSTSATSITCVQINFSMSHVTCHMSHVKRIGGNQKEKKKEKKKKLKKKIKK